jgi:SPP1 gp7 family putative phage head morphogenesis protein
MNRLLRRLFLQQQDKPPQPPAVVEVSKPNTSELAFASDSFLYAGKDFAKYNPDLLYTYKGLKVYDRMMEDDQVKPVVEFKQGAVVSRGYFFDCRKDEESGEVDPQHAEIKDFFDVCLERMDGNFTDKLIEVLSAIKYGFSISEKIHAPITIEGRDYWGLKDIKLRPHATFHGGIITDLHGNISAIKQKVGAADIELPLEKVIHFVHRPDIDRHYGESDLKAAYRPWWGKDIAIKFQNIHLERHSGGFIWAQIDPSKGALPVPELEHLKSALNNITAHTAMTVPAAVTLNAIQPLRTDAYEKAIAGYNMAIARSILVPNLLGLSVQGDTGSYSQAQTQLEVFFWVLDLIANRLAETLNEQLFKELAVWNFGTDDYPKFTFEPISEEKKRQILQTWSDLVSKGAVTKSNSDEAHIRQMMNFPEKTEEEPEEVPPTLPPGDEETPPGEAEAGPGEEDMEPAEEPDEKEQEKFRQRAPKEFEERRWLRRVNFSKIEKTMSSSDKALAAEMSSITAKIKQALQAQIVKLAGQRSFGNVGPGEILVVTIPKGLVTALRKSLRDGLLSSLDESYEQARRELPKKLFARVGPGMDRMKAEKFLASRSMKIAGVLDTDILAAVQRVLESSIKYDKTLKDTLAAIEEDTELLSVLPTVDAAGRAVNVPARLENISRTNTSDAVNQARMSLFGDPELKGFVVAYEYSAILDDRTTEVCEKLHGKIQKDWGTMVPPNHYQCRSLLVPVTEIDEWDGKQDKLPDVKPQKGFA